MANDKQRRAPREDEEPERAVDPPVATSTQDVERAPERQEVRLTKTATLTLPSGASYAFSAGDTRRLKPQDASFVVDQGYGVRADEG